MTEARPHPERDSYTIAAGALAAGVGGFLGAFATYLLISAVLGGLGWYDTLTFGQRGNLELESVAISGGQILGATLGAPLGAYLVLLWAREPLRLVTALATLVATGAATWLVFRFVRTGPEHPIMAPYLVFGAWFVVPLLTRWVVAARAQAASKRDADG